MLLARLYAFIISSTYRVSGVDYQQSSDGFLFRKQEFKVGHIDKPKMFCDSTVGHLNSRNRILFSFL